MVSSLSLWVIENEILYYKRIPSKKKEQLSEFWAIGETCE
jgi:hypothetical protein